MPRDVERARWPLFLSKAEEFLGTAHAAFDAGSWNSCASACVHASILACDALTAGSLGMRNSGGHEDVVPLVGRVLKDDVAVKEDVQKRLKRLLKKKNIAEYEDRDVERGEAETCLKDATRVVEIARARTKTF